MKTSSKNRHGFTLVELLVVIAIIGVLAALTTAGVFVMLGRQQTRNTEATIRVVNKLMQDRWGAVIADARKERPSGTVLALAGNNMERAKVIWVKVRLMEAFPQTYAEVNTPTVLTNLMAPDQKFKPHFIKYQAALQGKSGGGAGESSACLLLALKTLNADNFAAVQDQFNYAVADSDGDGMPEFMDAFGQPLMFTRFTQWPNVQAANPAAPGTKAAKFCDPVDTGGLLLTPGWYTSGLRGPPTNPPNPLFASCFEANIHPVSPDKGATAYFTIPVIMSAGKDGIMPSADDIYSFNLTGN